MPPPVTLADIDPARMYPLGAYAAAMGYTQRTAQNHVKAGHLKAVRVGRRGEFRVLGAEIIRLAGGQQPRPSETEAQRAARGRAARDELRRLAKQKS